MAGRSESEEIKETAQFKPTGNDHIRITVTDRTITIQINNETVIGNVSIPQDACYRMPVYLMLGDHSIAKHNQKNRYNNIRVRKINTL